MMRITNLRSASRDRKLSGPESVSLVTLVKLRNRSSVGEPGGEVGAERPSWESSGGAGGASREASWGVSEGATRGAGGAS